MIKNQYRLSNIARNSIKNNNKDKKYRVLYYPCLSVIDSIIGSIPNILVYSEQTIPPIGFDIILSYNNISSTIINKSIQYHRPIINISSINKKTNIDENKNTYNIDISEDIIKTLFPKIADPQKYRKDLLYIRDTDIGISNMISNFLSSKGILFETISPEDFILIETNNLIDIFSKYKTVLTNTNAIDLYAASLSGATPITFNSALCNPEFSICVSEENFENEIKDGMNKQTIHTEPYTTNQLNLFNQSILDAIEEISNKQFIL